MKKMNSGIKTGSKVKGCSKARKLTACALSGILSFALLGAGAFDYFAAPLAAANEDGATNTDTASKNRQDFTKSQVVYAKGTATGDICGVYVVNNFTSSKNASIKDCCDYSNITNLTDTSEIKTDNNTCSFTTNDKGEFMYQGDMPASTELPWSVSVKYKLDGKTMPTDELAGKSGSLKMIIKIKPTNGNSSIKDYSDNFLIQASAKLDNSICSNIVADGATSAQSSGSTQLSYMVFPGKNGNFTINCDVTDFEFDGWTIVGVPLSIALNIDDDEFSDATDDLTKLKDAIEKLDYGAYKLNIGSGDVAAGLNTLSSMSSNLSSGASSFQKAINKIKNGTDKLDTSISEDLTSGTKQLSIGSKAYIDGINSQVQTLKDKTSGSTTEALKAGYAQALSTYTQTYTAVYTQIYTQLIQTGQSADEASQNAASQAMQNESVASALSTLNNKVEELAEFSGNLGAMQGLLSATSAYSEIDSGISSLNSSAQLLAEGSSSLSSGMDKLASGYENLNSGISKYTAGVDKLAGNYKAINSGTETLSNGTKELRDETSDIDTKMIETVKDKLMQYLNPDFTMRDFVNGDTEHIERVQFIYMTDAIDAEEETSETQSQDESQDKKQEEQGFFEKLAALFR